MDTRFVQHGQDNDIKASRSKNKEDLSNIKTKTKTDMASNKQEGTKDEPSHSGQR